MAIMVQRIPADDLADALRALDEVLRFAHDTRASLDAALAQDAIEPGTLEHARRAAAITACSATHAERAVRMALLRRLEEIAA